MQSKFGLNLTDSGSIYVSVCTLPYVRHCSRLKQTAAYCIWATYHILFVTTLIGAPPITNTTQAPLHTANGCIWATHYSLFVILLEPLFSLHTANGCIRATHHILSAITLIGAPPNTYRQRITVCLSPLWKTSSYNKQPIKA